LALDVGGANLKVADGRRVAVSEAFPLWKEPEALAAAIERLLREAPPAERIVATMTGELADCFRTKAEGVAAIVGAAQQAAGARDVRIYMTDGSLVSPSEAVRRPWEAAASNWHALARFVARWLPGGNGLLIDIGSTTCDLIPLREGWPATQGKTDPDRLAAGELVYTGVWRSPVCAVLGELPWRDASCPVAQELFATTLDAYLMLGDLCEEPHNTSTADGRTATREYARERLARMICADREMFSEEDALTAARAIRDAQTRRIAASRPLKTIPATVIVSGQGEFLARQVLEQVGFAGQTISLADKLGAEISQVAPAHALAVLSMELS
jgi:probable H4MPT-linked C1 transfer pathway protein